MRENHTPEDPTADPPDAAADGPGPVARRDEVGGTDVMCAVDAAEFVIADVARDGAWLSMDDASAPVLEDWR